MYYVTNLFWLSVVKMQICYQNKLLWNWISVNVELNLQIKTFCLDHFYLFFNPKHNFKQWCMQIIYGCEHIISVSID